SVELIATALAHRVNHAARRTAIFSRIVGRIYLKLLHRRLGARVARSRAAPLFREECLVIIRAIDRIVVQQSADSSEAEQTETAGIIHDSRREQRKIRPSSSIDGVVRNLGLVNILSHVGGS